MKVFLDSNGHNLFRTVEKTLKNQTVWSQWSFKKKNSDRFCSFSPSWGKWPIYNWFELFKATTHFHLLNNLPSVKLFSHPISEAAPGWRRGWKSESRGVSPTSKLWARQHSLSTALAGDLLRLKVLEFLSFNADFQIYKQEIVSFHSRTKLVYSLYCVSTTFCEGRQHLPLGPYHFLDCWHRWT